MDNNPDEHALIVQANIYDNIQYYGQKTNKYDSKLDKLTSMIEKMMDHNQNSNSSPENMDSPKSQDPTNMVPDKTKDTPLAGGNYMKIGDMWTLKHEII